MSEVSSKQPDSPLVGRALARPGGNANSSLREDSGAAANFRRILGHYPTGVSVIGAVDPFTGPAGMVVGSFTSVSLDPPLVGFFPDRSSTTWPKIARTGSFGVSILSANQKHLCRRMAQKSAGRFTGVEYAVKPSGSLFLPGAVAWLECSIVSQTEAGDHFAVLGRVEDLGEGTDGDGLPLIFYKGNYGRFSPAGLTAMPLGGHLNAV